MAVGYTFHFAGELIKLIDIIKYIFSIKTFCVIYWSPIVMTKIIIIVLIHSLYPANDT